MRWGKTHSNDEPDKDDNLHAVRIRDDRRRDIRPVQGDIQQTNSLRPSPKEVDLVIIRGEPAEWRQSCNHGEQEFREELPGERDEHDGVKDLSLVSDLGYGSQQLLGFCW